MRGRQPHRPTWTPTNRRLGRVGLLLAAWLLLGADSCQSVVHVGDPPDCGTDPPPKSCQSPPTQPAARPPLGS
jgi:hypothetical protein